MTLTEVARRLQEILGERAVVIGGVCGAVLGVERFTRDVDFATDLGSGGVIDVLGAEGIEVRVSASQEPDDLPWVIHGMLDDVPFQVLPAGAVGVTVSSASLRAGLRVPRTLEFILSKCIAAGHQDLHDVAVLCLLDSELLDDAKLIADAHGVLDRLEMWLSDDRLRKRYEG